MRRLHDRHRWPPGPTRGSTAPPDGGSADRGRASPGRLATVAGALLLSLSLGCQGGLPTEEEPAPTAAELTWNLDGGSVVGLGSTVRLQATARDPSGRALPDYTITWESSDPSVLSAEDDGSLTAVALGSAVIRASAEDPGNPGKGKDTAPGQLKKETEVVVDPVPVASVEVTPSQATLEVDATAHLSAITRDADGDELTDRVVSWSTSASSVATVDETGTVTGRGVGTATITATSEEQSATAAVDVVADSEPDRVFAFPGAEGFGRMARGGRGGAVHLVTNTNDAGPGSLRACVEASGPRTCVFRVAGTITLASDLDVENPYLTIAGQTAPGGGVTLKSADPASSDHLRVETHDVIVRYIRSRPGTSAENARALTVSNSDAAPYNVMIDHVSLSWAGDEIFISWYDARDITVQWSSLSESLPFEDGGYKGPNLGDGGQSGRLTLHHNLLAHHNQRFPLTRTGEGPVDLVNNVMYDLGTYGHANLRESTKANLVGNYVKPGPNSTIETFVREESLTDGGYYRSGNVVEAGWSVESIASDEFRVSTPYAAPPVTTTGAEQAYDDVLADAGAVHGLRCDGTWFERPDAVDLRIVQSVREGTRGHDIPPEQTPQQLGFISDPADVGGWPALESGAPCADGDADGMPDVWEEAVGLDPGADDSAGDLDGDGYTNLEEYLNGSGT